MEREKSILLVDDHDVVRMGVKMLLEQMKMLCLCGEADDCLSARELAAELQPDIVVLDLMMGTRNGFELIADIRAVAPGARVIVYSALDEKLHARRALGAGASGYVMKSSGIGTLQKALEAALRAETYVSETIRQSAVDNLVGRGEQANTGDPAKLSVREMHVFWLLGSGLGSSQIAEAMHLSPKTIGTYYERLKRKLGVRSARELAHRAEEDYHTETRRKLRE